MLAILTTHPIQYQVPLWQALTKEGGIPFEVWYLSRHGVAPSHDVEFKKSFSWDLDLLSGYPSQFVNGDSSNRIDRFLGSRLNRTFSEWLKAKRVKALWIQGWQVIAYWQAVWQAKKANIPVWLRGESNDLAIMSPWKDFPKRFFLRHFFKSIQHFLYIGEANRRLYERYGVSSERLHPAPYCVDNERFIRQAEELLPRRDLIRREWKIPEEAFCVLFAGKFIPKKRPLDLVRAVCNGRFKHSAQPIHLLFAGSGELGEKLRHACHTVFDAESKGQPEAEPPGSQEGDKPRASFVGFLNQTEISKAYVAADCLVLPSDSRETWGLVVNEAMASGIPCAVSDACGSAEDLTHTLHPRLRFRMGNHEALADVLLLLMENPFSRQTLQAHLAKFDINSTIQTVRKLYLSSVR